MSAIPPGSDPEPVTPAVLEYHQIHNASASAIIWCRILALWMFAWGLYCATTSLGQFIYIISAGQNSSQMQLRWMAVASLPSIVIWFLLAWYCWAKAPKLGARIVGDIVQQHTSQRGIVPDELLGVVIIGLGAYLLAIGLPVVTWGVYQIIVLRAWNPGARSLPELVQEQGIFPALIRCMLGLWFIMGTPRAVSLLRRLRYGAPRGESGDTVDPAPPP